MDEKYSLHRSQVKTAKTNSIRPHGEESRSSKSQTNDALLPRSFTSEQNQEASRIGRGNGFDTGKRSWRIIPIKPILFRSDRDQGSIFFSQANVQSIRRVGSKPTSDRCSSEKRKKSLAGRKSIGSALCSSKFFIFLVKLKNRLTVKNTLRKIPSSPLPQRDEGSAISEAKVEVRS